MTIPLTSPFPCILENKWFCSVTLVSVKFISNMHYSLSKGKCALNFSITLDVLQEYNIHMVQNSVFKTGFKTGMKWLLSSDSLDKLHWGILSLPLLDDIKPAGSVFLHIFLPSWTSGSDSVAHDCSQNTARTTALSTIHYLPHGYQNAFVYQVLAYCSVLHKLTTSLYPALLYKLSEYLVFVFKDKIITLFYILLIIPTVLCKALLDSYMVKRAN